jgi:protein subunit release factor B
MREREREREKEKEREKKREIERGAKICQVLFKLISNSRPLQRLD